MSENNPENQQPQPAQPAKPVEPAQPVQQAPPATGGKLWDHFQLILPELGAWVAIAAIGILCIGIVILLVGGLFWKNPIVRELASVDYARGVITFIFAVGTIGIALLLTLGALLGSHPLDVFAKAKEVLTVLIGVFGTILGFYFGTSTGDASHKLSISSPAIEASADGKTVTMLAYISGGDSPYIYNINFDKNASLGIRAKTSTDGWIREVIDATKIGASPLGYTISVTDAHKKSVEHEATDKEQIRDQVPAWSH